MAEPKFDSQTLNYAYQKLVAECDTAEKSQSYMLWYAEGFSEEYKTVTPSNKNDVLFHLEKLLTMCTKLNEQINKISNLSDFIGKNKYQISPGVDFNWSFGIQLLQSSIGIDILNININNGNLSVDFNSYLKFLSKNPYKQIKEKFEPNQTSHFDTISLEGNGGKKESVRILDLILKENKIDATQLNSLTPETCQKIVTILHSEGKSIISDFTKGNLFNLIPSEIQKKCDLLEQGIAHFEQALSFAKIGKLDTSIIKSINKNITELTSIQQEYTSSISRLVVDAEYTENSDEYKSERISISKKTKSDFKQTLNSIETTQQEIDSSPLSITVFKNSILNKLDEIESYYTNQKNMISKVDQSPNVIIQIRSHIGPNIQIFANKIGNDKLSTFGESLSQIDPSKKINITEFITSLKSQLENLLPSTPTQNKNSQSTESEKTEPIAIVNNENNKSEKQQTLRQKFDINNEEDFNNLLAHYAQANKDYYSKTGKKSEEDIKKRRNLNAQFKRIIAKKAAQMPENENGDDFSSTITSIEKGEIFSYSDLKQVAENNGATLRLFNIMASGTYEKDGQRIKLTQKQRVALAATLEIVSGLRLDMDKSKKQNKATPGNANENASTFSTLGDN